LAAVKAATFHSKNPLAMKMILTLAAAALAARNGLRGRPNNNVARFYCTPVSCEFG
jgi:hypothetical protein